VSQYGNGLYLIGKFPVSFSGIHRRDPTLAGTTASLAA
jgi:hypothetical protein